MRRSAPLLVLLLAACGSLPPETQSPAAPIRNGSLAQPEPTDAGSVAASVGKQTFKAAQGGGAYYKDDGPAADIPVDLDAVPDAEPKLELLHRYANNPYTVLGQSYQPLQALTPLRQRGVGSWYGRKFHGQRTSSGEPYDMFAMTAAHPTLPIPSYARVSNVKTGKSVLVRINDRGPFHRDRIIDLSFAAAWRLGYAQNGSTELELETVIPGQPAPAALASTPASAVNPPAASAPAATAPVAAPPLVEPQAATPGEQYFVQLAAFASASNADAYRNHAARELTWLGKLLRIDSGNGVHRVRVGPFPDRSSASQSAERIASAFGIKPALSR